MFGGIPYIVRGLGPYCRLVNPLLQGGDIRVNAKYLLDSFGREFDPNESFFPSKTGDYVELSDGKFGMIKIQTPENVILELFGGELVHYPTLTYLGLNPKNYGTSFTISFIIGIDYSHLALATNQILEILRNELSQELSNILNNVAPLDFKVDFDNPNSSSLDYLVLVKLSGNLAKEKSTIERRLKKCFVEICHRHQYVIPFPQMTVNVTH